MHARGRGTPEGRRRLTAGGKRVMCYWLWSFASAASFSAIRAA